MKLQQIFLHFFLSACLCILPVGGRSQNFKSVKMYFPDKIEELPVLTLGSSEQCLVEFDDVEDQNLNLSYRIRHCNSDFEPSTLQSIEYLRGPLTLPVTDYEYSFNTSQNYTHYQFRFPDAQQKILLSGAYLLEIFEADNPNKTLLRIPFWVCESKTLVQAEIVAPRRVEWRRSHQEIKVKIQPQSGFAIAQPKRELKVVLQQNHNPMTRRVLPLQNVGSDGLEYKDMDELCIEGLSEYRNFDIRPLSYAGRNVEYFDRKGGIYHAFLFNEESYQFKEYNNADDINGNYVVKAERKGNSGVEADYAYVHFFLKSPILPQQDIYVVGSFNQWQKTKENKMYYNVDLKLYTQRILLKQGFYDYMYLLDDGKDNNFVYFQNSYQETRNDYYLFVYYRGNGERYEQLVGFQKVTSRVD